VEVLQEQRARENDESRELVSHDHAIRLTRADNLVVVLAAHRSIGDYLDLAFDANTAAALTDGCVPRVVLE
jgi:hypothetical protein